MVGKMFSMEDWGKTTIDEICYELRSLGLDNRTTLVLSNIRELDRELCTR